MNYKPAIQEKMLGIFTPVRCLSEQQLQRYAAGNLPVIEQHLIEQHLVDCELCNEAVKVFRTAKGAAQCAAMIPWIREQIRAEYLKASLPAAAPAVEKAKNLKKAQQKEKLLIYSWSVLLGAFCIGGAAFLIYHYKDNSSGNPYGRASETAAAGRLPDTETMHVTARPVSRDLPLPAPVRQKADTAKIAGARPPAPSRKDTLAAITAWKTAAEEAATRNIKPKPASSAPAAPSVTRLENDPELGNHAAGNTADSGKTPVSQAAPAHEDTETAARKPASARKQVAESREQNPPPEDPDEVLYSSAKTYLAQGNVDDAISRFKFLADNNGNRYHQQAKFQLALCYKAKGKNRKARKLLRQIVDDGGIMKAQAQRELDDLQ